MLDAMAMERIRVRLLARRDALHIEVQEGRRMETVEQLRDLAGEVRDAGDESVGIEQVDLRNALVNRDAAEVQAIDGALARIETGEYGICASCGVEIEPARLEVQPSALRCTYCQEVHERQFALLPASPSL